MKLRNILNEDEQFETALQVLAEHLVREADLDYLYDGGATVEDIAGELLEGRWTDMLGDKIVDLLHEEVRKHKS